MPLIRSFWRWMALSNQSPCSVTSPLPILLIRKASGWRMTMRSPIQEQNTGTRHTGDKLQQLGHLCTILCCSYKLLNVISFWKPYSYVSILPLSTPLHPLSIILKCSLGITRDYSTTLLLQLWQNQWNECVTQYSKKNPKLIQSKSHTLSGTLLASQSYACNISFIFPFI